MDKYSKALLETIEILVNERMRNLKFNYYIEGSIISINENGTYDVDYNGNTLKNIKVREGLILQLNDIVLICVVNGNFSNKFIDLKQP